MSDIWDRLTAALSDPAKVQGVDRRGAYLSTADGPPVYVRELAAEFAALLARRAPGDRGDENRRLREALRLVEFYSVSGGRHCPRCDGGPPPLGDGHRDDCEVGRALAANSQPEQPAALAETLRTLTSAVDDYLWEVSPRDERGTCRVCRADEGMTHDPYKVCGKLADARRLAAEAGT